MNKRQNNTARASALQITLAAALISISAILLATSFRAAPKPEANAVTQVSPKANLQQLPDVVVQQAGFYPPLPAVPDASATPGCGYVVSFNGTGTFVPGVTDIGNHTDDGINAIALPFPVTFYTNTYTTANAGSNGFLSFATSINSFYTGCLPNSSFTFTIFPFETDQNTFPAGRGIFTTTTGVTPNRTFYIEWRNCKYLSSTTCIASSDSSYEIALDETPANPGDFSIIYGTFGSPNNTFGAIGSQGAAGFTTQLQCNLGRPANDKQTYSYTCPPPTPTPSGTPSPTPTATTGPCNYAFTVGTGAIVAGTTDVGNHTDDGSTVIALPFAYTLYNQSFNNVAVGSNGHVTFGAVNDGFGASCIPQATTTYAIFPYRTDQCTNACTGNTGATYGIFTSTSGVTPNRIFNIEFRTAYYDSADTTLNYEVRLFEGQTVFDVIYGTMNVIGAANDGPLTVGVQKDATNNTVVGACDPTGGQAPPVSTGQLYHYTLSGGCATPTATATATVTATATATATASPTPTPTPTPTPSPSPTPCLNYAVSVGPGSIVAGTTDIGNHGDDLSTVIALPFSYQLYDQTFSSVAAGSNGHLTFGTVNDSFNPACPPDATATFAIFPYRTDQCTSNVAECVNNVGTTYGIFTSISGVTPNRVFNIEYRTAYYNSADTVLNYEVRLFEGQTVFDVIYGTVNTFTPPSSRNLYVGVQRTNTTGSTLFPCDVTGGANPPVSSGQRHHYVLGINCPSPTPTATSTATATITATATATATASPTPTPTPPCFNYSFTNGPGAIVPGTTDIGNHTDDGATSISLPFPVTLYGNTYNTAMAGSNGFLSMSGTLINTFYSGCLPNAGFTFTIFPFEVDQRTDQTGGGIFTLTTGSTPNRTFYIEWRNCQYDLGGCLANSSTNYEIAFYEGQSFFDVFYGTFGTADATVGAIGVQGASIANFTQVQCNLGRPASSKQRYTLDVPCPTPTPSPSPSPDACQFTSATVMPIPIMDQAIASVGGNLYSFAGVSLGVNIANAYKFDGTTWTAIAPVPATLEGPAAVTDGTNIYIIGGDNGVNAVTTLYRYNVGADTYTTLASFTTAVWNPAAAYLNGKIYKFTGTNDTPASVNNLEIYDISGNSWSPGAPYPAAESFVNAWVQGNFIYAAGGVDATTATESLKTYRYDPGTNTWDDLAIADLPATRWGAASAFYSCCTNSGGVLAGGYSGGVITTSTLIWNIGTNSWTVLNPMLGERARMAGGILGCNFYVVGGRSSTSASFDGTNINQKFFCPCPSSPTPTPSPVNISGTVSYCSNPTLPPVPGVTMTLTGTMAGSTATNGSGFYQFLNLTYGGSYTVTPTKAALAPGSAGINTIDVIAIQKHFLLVGTPLSGCRLAAADVNASSSVNTVDVIATQKFFLAASGTANVGKYQFNPASQSYPNLTSNATTNYDAIVFGDVASTFVNRPAGGGGSDISSSEIGSNEIPSTVAAITLPEAVVDQSSSKFIAPVKTSEIDAQNNLVGFQGDLTFDERVVTFQSQPVQSAGLTGTNWNVSGNVMPGPGPIRTLRISAYSNDFKPLSGAGTLFELRMIRVNQAAAGTPLTWAAPPDQFIFIDADLNTQSAGNAAPGSVTTRPSQPSLR